LVGKPEEEYQTHRASLYLPPGTRLFANRTHKPVVSTYSGSVLVFFSCPALIGQESFVELARLASPAHPITEIPPFS
jgi:hypothetical protein